MKRSFLAGLLSLHLLGAGCMTIFSQGPYWKEPVSGEWYDEYFLLYTRDWYVYAGTVNDALLFLELPVLTWIDLPLSLAADTVILPLTIYQQLQQVEPEPEIDQPEGHGHRSEWYDDGRLKVFEYYFPGLLMRFEFFPDGRLRLQQWYSRGRSSYLREYDENGELIVEEGRLMRHSEYVP